MPRRLAHRLSANGYDRYLLELILDDLNCCSSRRVLREILSEHRVHSDHVTLDVLQVDMRLNDVFQVHAGELKGVTNLLE